MFFGLFRKKSSSSKQNTTSKDLYHSDTVQPKPQAKPEPKVYPDTLLGRTSKYIDDFYKDTSHIRYSLDVDAYSPPAKEEPDNTVKFSRSGVFPVQNGDYTIWLNDAASSQTFSDAVKDYMIQEGLTSSEVCSRVYMDRRLFSKLNTDPKYQPSKETAIALCLALHLSYEDAEALLKKAGYALSHSIQYDLAIEYFLKNEVYDIDQINEVLDALNMKCFGVKK